MGVEPAEHPLLDLREVDHPAHGIHLRAAPLPHHLDVDAVVVAVEEGTLALVLVEPMPRAEFQLADEGELGGGCGHGAAHWAATASAASVSMRIGWISNFGFCPRKRQGLL